MPKLAALNVARQNEPGRYSDENGLILQVSKNRSGLVRKSWLVRYALHGKRREMGIGSFPEIALKEAREAAIDVRRKVQDGVDPIQEREQAKTAAAAEHAKKMTFADCAELYITAHEPSWKNAKHRQQWRNTLITYAYPIIGEMDVADVGLSEVMRILEPIWYTKTETASRLRGRIETILSWAIVRGHREPPNPALWRGHLDMLLPKQSKIQTVKHHAALDWKALPRFIADLRKHPAPSARALEFTILTAVRSGELRLATWKEIDWDEALWIIPAERMKMKKEHKVPLSQTALQILSDRREAVGANPDEFLFYHQSATTPFSDAVYRALFERMKRSGITTHGFRSTFRDWAGEETNHPREIAEMALAHQVGDATERAYRRGDALSKRRVLMDEWAAYCICYSGL